MKREDKMGKNAFCSLITGKFLKPLIFLVLFLGIIGTANATNLRGQLLRIGPYGNYPAGKVGLHLENSMSPGLIFSQPTYTNSFGMYFFYNIPAGSYLLVVPRRNAPALRFQIIIPHMTNDPRVFYDIAPVQLP